MEALYDGRTHAPLIAIGALSTPTEEEDFIRENFLFKIEIPSALSYMVYLSPEGFVPGIKDLVHGNEQENFISFAEKIERGDVAISTLREMKKAKDTDPEKYSELRAKFEDEEWVNSYFRYFGYGYYKGMDPHDIIPNVPASFYSFHLMVILGFYFFLLLVLVLYFGIKDRLENKRWLLYITLWTIPLAYIASQAGWVLAEMGRQPWVVQDLLPTIAAVSHVNTTTVQITFFLFALTFTALLIAEIKIMIKQIKIGPKEGGK